MSTITVGPLTRVEGHLDIEAEVTNRSVVAAKSSGTMFRGFEVILQGRDPLDAPHYTQRICGVCPISHGMAASMGLESAFGVAPADNGRIMRNLVLGSNFIASHVLHFYHLAALDYIDTTGLLNRAPWTPSWISPDMVRGATASKLVGHYVEALAIRRKAHQMAAIFGGKLPCSPAFVPGGFSSTVTAAKVKQFRSLLAEIRQFVADKFVPDVKLLGSAFPDYWHLGKGCGNLLAYGVFDLDSSGTNKLLARGRYTNKTSGTVAPGEITEYLKYSYYAAAGENRNPASGVTQPQYAKSGAYSWIKAPRYTREVHEVGPLARMWVNRDYQHGISVLDRLTARALEALKIATAMSGWLDQLRPGVRAQTAFKVPAAATGRGMTEAPRGALGHWIEIRSSRIYRYQIVTPTGWNASPRDGLGQPGPIEQALLGTPVANESRPIELLRVVHSFDPCLACSVHTVRPRGR